MKPWFLNIETSKNTSQATMIASAKRHAKNCNLSSLISHRRFRFDTRGTSDIRGNRCTAVAEAPPVPPAAPEAANDNTPSEEPSATGTQ
jgi:hypothetical protein